MRILQAILLLGFLAAILVFAVQNQQPLTVRFGNRALSAPVALISVVVYLLGMLTGGTVVSFLRRSIRRVGEERHSR